ncbi:hypothetical protein [Arthrobacter zhaoguopingii]|uniref:hypothetical protein n=1 Tax=Arthrobacter zhaoguopingii TaxID=2681491 RepID=UPI00135CDA73|nr:hypothetical protein [Arthrobacter zhaoguopingii]
MRQGLRFLWQSLVASLVFVVSMLAILALALMGADHFLFWEDRQGRTCKSYDPNRCRDLSLGVIVEALGSPLPSGTKVVHSKTYRDEGIAYLEADLEIAGPVSPTELETSEPGYLVSVTDSAKQEGIKGIFIRIEARNGIRGLPVSW